MVLLMLLLESLHRKFDMWTGSVSRACHKIEYDQLPFYFNDIAICLSTRCFKFLYPEEVCIALAKRFGSCDCRV